MIETMIGRRTIGKTDIKISPIGIGTMMWSGVKNSFIGRVMEPLSEDVKNSIIKEAFDGGINFFDTAEMYGFGSSESNLVQALKSNDIADEDVIIETKWSPFLRRAQNMRKTINDRIRYLDGYTIDLYMIHGPWLNFSSVKSQMEEMVELFKANKIRSVGVSNFSEKQMRTAFEVLEKHGIPLAANQVNYSLIKREIEHNGVLDTAKELGVTITAYTPLGAGILTGKYHDNPELVGKKFSFLRGIVKKNFEKSKPLVETLKVVAQSHDVLPGQVALNWLVTNSGDTVVAIPGATKIGHARESAGALTFELSKSEFEEISIASEIFL